MNKELKTEYLIDIDEESSNEVDLDKSHVIDFLGKVTLEVDRLVALGVPTINDTVYIDLKIGAEPLNLPTSLGNVIATLDFIKKLYEYKKKCILMHVGNYKRT